MPPLARRQIGATGIFQQTHNVERAHPLLRWCHSFSMANKLICRIIKLKNNLSQSIYIFFLFNLLARNWIIWSWIEWCRNCSRFRFIRKLKKKLQAYWLLASVFNLPAMNKRKTGRVSAFGIAHRNCFFPGLSRLSNSSVSREEIDKNCECREVPMGLTFRLQFTSITTADVTSPNPREVDDGEGGRRRNQHDPWAWASA